MNATLSINDIEDFFDECMVLVRGSPSSFSSAHEGALLIPRAAHVWKLDNANPKTLVL